MAKLTFRIWVLIIVVLLSLISIFSIPPIALEKGILVGSVKENSTIFQDGLREGMVIKSINGNAIESLDDYSNAMSVFNNLADNDTQKLDIKVNDKIGLGATSSEIINLYTKEILSDVSVEKIQPTRIETGLDLRGGARAFVKADVPLTDAELDDLISVSEERLNVYGLSDVKFLKIKDSEGTNLMEVEIAGSSPDDLEELIAKQGKFEAKIGNETVFTGGNKDM